MTWYDIFPQILNMSLTASVVIGFVWILRLFLRRAPKIYSYVLWSVVLFRLLCPVSLSAPVSLLRVFDAPVVENTADTGKAEGVSTSTLEYIPSNLVHEEYPEISLPVPVVGDTISEAVNERLPQGWVQATFDPLEAPVTIATYVWMFGILCLSGYGMVSYIKLRQKLVGALKLRDNIYLADHIRSPFVMGILRPRIYMPSDLAAKEQTYIILHEQHHIRRLDPVLKMLAFAALCIHWFNPLVWMAFLLSGKDMEMSCDEAVVKKLGEEIRAEYSASLLQLATGQRIRFGTSLAFGEGEPAGRIKNLARLKRPTITVTILAVFVCVVGILICVFNPAAAYDSVTMVEQDTTAGGNRVAYEMHLGEEVGSAVVIAEQWVDGTCTSSSPVTLPTDVEELQILMRERKENGKTVGIDIQIDTEEVGGSLLTYFAFPQEHSVIGWSFTAYKEEEKLEVFPGEELILAAMAFDQGNGVRVFDCETLINEPERLENADQMLVIRAAFLEETAGAVREEASSLPVEVFTEANAETVSGDTETVVAEEDIMLEDPADVGSRERVEKITAKAEMNLREGYEPARLTYIDNSKAGWDYYSDEPWETDEQRDVLAQAAMQELYTLTGYQVKECVYTTDGRSRFIFGKSEEYIRKSIAFYSRDYGFGLAGDSVPYMGFVNARRVHYSDVQQLESPYHKEEYSGHGAIPTWFLEQSGVYQGEKILGFDAINLDDTVYTHIKLHFDGGYYLVVMDEKIESVSEVSGPYFDEAGE